VKITKSRLKQIIKEELERALQEQAADFIMLGHPDTIEAVHGHLGKPLTRNYYGPDHARSWARQARKIGLISKDLPKNYPPEFVRELKFLEKSARKMRRWKSRPARAAREMQKIVKSWAKKVAWGAEGALLRVGDVASQTYKKAPKPAQALGAAGGALATVDAIDALAGPELRKIIARLTGASAEEIANIPTPTLKARAKRLVGTYTAPFTMGAGFLRKQFLPTEEEEREARNKAGFERKVASEKETEWTAKKAGGKNVRRAPLNIGRHRLPIGTKLADVREE